MCIYFTYRYLYTFCVLLIPTYILKYICIYMKTNMPTYLYLHTLMFVRSVFLFTYINVSEYIHAYIHTHTCVYTYIYICFLIMHYIYIVFTRYYNLHMCIYISKYISMYTY